MKIWMIEANEVAPGVHVATDQPVKLNDLQKPHVVFCVEKKDFDELFNCAKKLVEALELIGEDDCYACGDYSIARRALAAYRAATMQEGN